KRAYCLKTQPATGETYPKSDLFNKAILSLKKPYNFPLKNQNTWHMRLTVNSHIYLCECTGAQDVIAPDSQSGLRHVNAFE
ncbi:hypothetical protein QCN14_25020, partial [Enterobacter roggenkampii]|uniref:hypothetical protein n=1 Tax=Enterobacter roggenkampii TaxID=1812935 RepID=UPI002FD7DD28